MFGIPKAYLILAAVFAAIGIYFYGHHKGWTAVSYTHLTLPTNREV